MDSPLIPFTLLSKIILSLGSNIFSPSLIKEDAFDEDFFHTVVKMPREISSIL